MVTKPSVSQSKNSSHNQESKQSNKIRKSNKWNDPKGKRKCPFYKKITGTTFCVDAFSYGPISGITAYFLSHFHSDHYYGLNKTFNAKLYCNKITANLVSRMLHVEKQYITILPMHQSVVVDDVEVTLLDANHCPGSAMFVFRLRNGSVHLHTGDFRASEEMEKLDILKNSVISELYLDTTYCDPSYDFPSQKFVLDYVLATVTDALKCNKRCLVACGTYTIGKEKVFLAIARALECKVYAQKNKLGTLQCLEIENFKTLFTSDPHSTFLHVLPIWSVSAKFLRNYLDQNADQFDCAIGFKPTGWTHTNNVTASGIVARQYGSISIYGVPYSEHSSYSEMRRFVQFTKPRKIIPTVNVGSPEKRREMNMIFQQWRS
ncbi:uncharacterized protein TRIADDRAFT_31281 [Trichoplax adhaerens]|uniref:DNA cross-link repair 1A protein n=1 Tax=Trichoplax adhaerens TaxID=10228 RepID=B3S8X5_TRIAD|nr:hypothetical protein TRIADDRAFT_31281 [Trichoplax adhaerens]EDV20779.1 hypothetical protein TRIADDRAFT_31281 [Trichoplax adhaerens]|eukprot:XP_002116720.1 hypothetical protein TRIADDRAFT_31281 [Trichoplax adhaerens]